MKKTLDPRDKARLEKDLQRLPQLLENMPDPGLICEVVSTVNKLMEDQAERGDVKIINSALKELRNSFKVFSQWRHVRKASIFGSARTGEDQPEYLLAARFARQLSGAGWMVITGAASGIMKAGHEGAGREKSFGVNIRLPFEQKANVYIENDTKLITYKYFFTRKLVFIKESDAIVLFPGGFGTHDEGFEALTLVQTGKCPPRPIVMVAPAGNDYWRDWQRFVHKHLLNAGLISESDLSLFRITHCAEDAVEELTHFYSVYHSSRFIGQRFVIRLNKEVSDAQLGRLNREFTDIIVRGSIKKSKASPEEANEPQLKDLPRLLFYFNRRDWGRLRQMINSLNAM